MFSAGNVSGGSECLGSPSHTNAYKGATPPKVQCIQQQAQIHNSPDHIQQSHGQTPLRPPSNMSCASANYLSPSPQVPPQISYQVSPGSMHQTSNSPKDPKSMPSCRMQQSPGYQHLKGSSRTRSFSHGGMAFEPQQPGTPTNNSFSPASSGHQVEVDKQVMQHNGSPATDNQKSGSNPTTPHNSSLLKLHQLTQGIMQPENGKPTDVRSGMTTVNESSVAVRHLSDSGGTPPSRTTLRQAAGSWIPQTTAYLPDPSPCRYPNPGFLERPASVQPSLPLGSDTFPYHYPAAPMTPPASLTSNNQTTSVATTSRRLSRHYRYQPNVPYTQLRPIKHNVPSTDPHFQQMATNYVNKAPMGPILNHGDYSHQQCFTRQNSAPTQHYLNPYNQPRTSRESYSNCTPHNYDFTYPPAVAGYNHHLPRGSSGTHNAKATYNQQCAVPSHTPQRFSKDTYLREQSTGHAVNDPYYSPAASSHPGLFAPTSNGAYPSYPYQYPTFYSHHSSNSIPPANMGYGPAPHYPTR